MSRSRSRRALSQINVVPYIDVMLVLLVIFMVTAPLVNPGQVELPQVGEVSLTPTLAPMEITVLPDGKLLFRDRAEGAVDQSVSRSQMIALVRERQAKAPAQAVVIAADRNVRYEEVIRVMDLLQQARVKKIGLLAKPRKG